MSLLLLFRPTSTQEGLLNKYTGDWVRKQKGKKKKELELLQDPSENSELITKITLDDLINKPLDFNSPAFQKTLKALAEEEQAILLMMMLDYN